MASSIQTGLLSLPNEVICSILSNLPTLALLPVIPTNKRIASLIIRILHHRILTAVCLPTHSLIFECYHPSVRLISPHMVCQYLRTELITSSSPTATSPRKDCQNVDDALSTTLGDLSNLYTSFRPIPVVSPYAQPRGHPAGGTIPSDQETSMFLPKTFTSFLNLESHELFSQLCTATKLVKSGTLRGLFSSCVTVGEGIIRVWRDWLEEQAKMCSAWDEIAWPVKEGLREDENISEDHDGKGKGIASEDGVRRGTGSILWADTKLTIGLRIDACRVGGGLTASSPAVPIASSWNRYEEDVDVTYNLEYQEVLIRSTTLLLKVEQSIEQECKNTGKRLIIGSWTP